MMRLFISALVRWPLSMLLRVQWPSAETTEWFSLRSALWWVIQLIPALHLFSHNASFRGLAARGSEGNWATAIGAMLLLQIIAMRLKNRWLRVAALVLFGATWGFIAGLFWAGNMDKDGFTHNTGVGVYACLATDCMAVAIHLVRLWYLDHLAEEARNPAYRSYSNTHGSGRAR